MEADHPAAGKLPYPGWPIRLASGKTVELAPAPLFGQDNQAILGAAGLGLPAEQLDSLHSLGII